MSLTLLRRLGRGFAFVLMSFLLALTWSNRAQSQDSDPVPFSADFTASLTSGIAGQFTTLTGSVTWTDPDLQVGPLTYEWTSDGPMVFADPTALVTEARLPRLGTPTGSLNVTLTVRENDGSWEGKVASKTMRIDIQTQPNLPPKANFNFATFIRSGQPFTLSSQGSFDPEGMRIT